MKRLNWVSVVVADVLGAIRLLGSLKGLHRVTRNKESSRVSTLDRTEQAGFVLYPAVGSAKWSVGPTAVALVQPGWGRYGGLVRQLRSEEWMVTAHGDHSHGQLGCGSTFSLSETFDVGVDAGTPVSSKYRVTNHYPYTGELDKVVFRLTD